MWKTPSLFRRKNPRGTKERLAVLCGFTVTFDGIILDSFGARAKVNYNQNSGYYTFSAEGKTVLAHRFVFHFLVRPIHPDKVIDHINGNRSDFRPENLREVTKGENAKNRLRGRTWQDAEVNHDPTR